MLFMKGSTHKVNNQTWLLCALIVLQRTRGNFYVKLGIKFVILAGSCVRAGYSRYIYRRTMWYSRLTGSHAKIKVTSEICFLGRNIYSTDQKYMTHKCLDTKCAFLYDWGKLIWLRFSEVHYASTSVWLSCLRTLSAIRHCCFANYNLVTKRPGRLEQTIKPVICNPRPGGRMWLAEFMSAAREISHIYLMSSH